jgi:hypothetical protein
MKLNAWNRTLTLCKAMKWTFYFRQHSSRQREKKRTQGIIDNFLLTLKTRSCPKLSQLMLHLKVNKTCLYVLNTSNLPEYRSRIYIFAWSRIRISTRRPTKLTEVLGWFLQSVQANVWKIPQMRPRPCQITFISICYSLVILSFNVMYYDIRTTPLN